MATKQLQTLTEPMFYLLLSLKIERHGYGIMQYVQELTNNRINIGPGTLYALLARFEEDNYIEMVSEENNKKIYRITKDGDQLLQVEIERLEQLLKDAKMVEGNRDNEN